MAISVFNYMTPTQIADVQANTALIDVTTPIQNAINALPSTGGTLYFPMGTYKVTSQLTISNSGVHLVGDGMRSSVIDFEPTSNAICFLFDAGSSVMYNSGISGFSFFSNDTTYTKTALKFINLSGYTVGNIGTQYPHFLGAGSTFVSINGREFGWFRDIYAEADRPIVCNPIPSPHTSNGIGIDQHNFHNIYLIASSSYPVIEFSTGLNLTQVSFTGTQSWVGGTYGLYWLDTTSSAVSNGLVLNNVRWEQGADNTKYLVYINHNYGLQGFTINSGQGGDRNGFYFRKVANILLNDFYYTSTTLEALNVDSTVIEIASNNSFWQAGSTATIGGQQLIFATPKDPNAGALAPTFQYTPATNAAPMNIGITSTFTPILNGFTQVLGGGTITATGRYTQIGNRVFFNIQIVAAGGATIASVANTSYISGLPSVSINDICYACQYNNTISLGNGSVSGSGNCSTPSWAAATGTFIISGNYEVS